MMLTIWMAYALFTSTCIGIAALAFERILAVWSLPRRWVWLLALATSVVLPLRSTIVPATFVRTARLEGVLAPRGRVDNLPRVARKRVPARTSAWILQLSRTAVRLDPWLERGWFVATTFFGLVLLRSVIALARRRRVWRAQKLLGTNVLIAPDVGPAVVGLLQPHVVVPEWALSLASTELSLLLRHEKEHLDARDPRALIVATLLVVAFPWNAAIWWMAHRLRLAVEIDCDARVLRAIDAPREYGLLLLAVGERRSFALPLSASLAERRSLLERRIHAMTSLRPNHPLIVSLPFAAIALAAGVAAAQSAPSSPVIEKAIVEAKLTRAAREQPSMTLSLTQLYTIIAANHAEVLQRDADESRVTIVLDRHDQYVRSVVQPAVIFDKAAQSDLAETRAAAERAVVLKKKMDVESAGTVTLKTREGMVGVEAPRMKSPEPYRTMSVEGLDEIPGELIRAVEKMHYERGEIGAAALNVVVIKLK